MRIANLKPFDSSKAFVLAELTAGSDPILPVMSGENLTNLPFHSPNKMIPFTSADGTNVSWDGNVATFTHNMNCIPLIAIYDENREQILYGIKVLNKDQFSINFKDKSVITGTWRIIISYGVAYPSDYPQ